MKKGLKITLIILAILVLVILTFFLIGYFNKDIKDYGQGPIKQSEENITIGLAYSIDFNETKSITLNQEETQKVTEILNNLNFHKETCDGISNYYINYSNENTSVSYGLETYESSYHITLSEKGEAVLSEDERDYIEQILEKYFK